MGGRIPPGIQNASHLARQSRRGPTGPPLHRSDAPAGAASRSGRGCHSPPILSLPAAGISPARGHRAAGQAPPAQLDTLSRSEAVLWIEPARDMKLVDEVAS